MIQLRGAARRYRMGNQDVQALHPTDLELQGGQLVVFLGPSGSGKTTLLNLIAGIDQPSEGQVMVRGTDLARLNRRGRLEFRRRHVGVVFQFHNLIPNLTARENVELVADLVGRRQHVDASLEAVGLARRAQHFPHEMSGGEQQRVAIARALVKDPAIVLGDEPTGNLDGATGRQVVSILCGLRSPDRCVLLVTHNVALAKLADRTVSLRDGRIVKDERNPAPLRPDQLEELA